MKTYGFIAALMLAASVSMTFTSCSDSDSPSGADGPETYTVRLSLGGDYADVSEEPLGRADGTSKYFGIRILSKDKTAPASTNYTPFAYGVFTDASNLVIELPKKNIYKFECTSVQGAGHELYVNNGRIYQPLGIEGQVEDITGIETNYFNISEIGSFKASTTKTLGDLSLHTTNVLDGSKGNPLLNYPSVKRYYGTLDNFDASSGKAVIDMRYMAFGVKLKINGVPDGSLSWIITVENEQLKFPESSCTGTEAKELEQTYLFHSGANLGADTESSTLRGKIDLIWSRPKKGNITIPTKEFTVKRKVRNVINITLETLANDANIECNEEETTMTDENTDINEKN